jgi:hypothetical protein
MALFEKGMTRTGGRAKGARNRLSKAFIDALAKDFEEHGEETIKIARVERPVEYCKMVAGLLPREFEITATSQVNDLSDEELDALIELARQQRAIVVQPNGGEEPALNREPVALLPPLRETN